VRLMARLGAAAALFALTLSAQTLEQAESLWKAARYADALKAFDALIARYPDNPDYKVRLGRLFLERFNSGEASTLFQQAIQQKKECAGAYVGLALIAADSYQGDAAELARTALKYDPALVEAQELAARLALEDNDNKLAAEEAMKALKLAPGSSRAKAVLAAMDALADKKDSQWDPHDAIGYEAMAHYLVINRRYDEGIAYYRKALALNPDLHSARSQLGVNLMRMGSSQEAYQQLLAASNSGYTDAQTQNSLNLLNIYQKFATYQSPGVVLKMGKKEGELLRPYYEREMAKILATYQKKYKIQLDGPVQVEVYPDHDDFAVRTMGLPGLGALGVTFGHSIAMDSPSSRTPGEFHWASTLWHEMSHVFTLAMTNSRVPRWFTEGIAVHEETAVSPEWGDRLGPDEIQAIKKKTLLPILELDRGFIHPKTPAQIGVSYFQGGRICDYITAKFGWDTILAMLHDFASNMDTASVIRKNLKMEPAEFDRQFLAAVEAETKRTVEGFDDWKTRVKKVAELAKAKDTDGVIREGTAIRDLYPDYVETGSVYEFLATAYLAKDDKPAAIAELRRYVRAGGRSPETLNLLAKQLADAGEKKEAAGILERLNYIYPMENGPHQRLGALWLDLGDVPGAIREFEAVISHNPIDPAEAHYQLARACRAAKQNDRAKDELFAALEAAPSYRPAQKLLLELTAAESGEAPRDPVKK
jgi:cellulose synthase operon protein C